MTRTAGWWRGLPTVLKASFLLVTLPAWLAIVYLMLAGEADSRRALVAFAVFAVSAIPHLFLDRRAQRDRGGGIDLSGGEG